MASIQGNNSLKRFVQHHAHACITILYSPIGPSHNDRIDIMMKTVDYICFFFSFFYINKFVHPEVNKK